MARTSFLSLLSGCEGFYMIASKLLAIAVFIVVMIYLDYSTRRKQDTATRQNYEAASLDAHADKKPIPPVAIS
jgi:hypothetical protein